MAFAQLTWRKSLRDIEVTLSANSSKLYAIGLHHAVRRSTLADLSAVLIRRARKLYQGENPGLDLTKSDAAFAPMVGIRGESSDQASMD